MNIKVSSVLQRVIARVQVQLCQPKPHGVEKE